MPQRVESRSSERTCKLGNLCAAIVPIDTAAFWPLHSVNERSKDGVPAVDDALALRLHQDLLEIELIEYNKHMTVDFTEHFSCCCPDKKERKGKMDRGDT